MPEVKDFDDSPVLAYLVVDKDWTVQQFPDS